MILKSLQILLSALLIFTFSCSSSEYLSFDPKNEYEVYFSLSNQNHFCVEPVHFNVTLTYSIEGKEKLITIFDEKMDFGQGILKGHTRKENKLILSEGKYNLVATTSSNNNKLDVEFEIVRPQWIYIGYNTNNQLVLKFSSTPFIFG